MPAKPKAIKGKMGYSLSAKIIIVIFVSTFLCVVLMDFLYQLMYKYVREVDKIDFIVLN